MNENVKRIRCGNGNCYIVSNGESAILIDTCREKYREKILHACKPYHICLLLLTHGHIDHIQNAAFLAEALQIPIAMNKADLPLIHDNLSQTLEADNMLGKMVLSVSVKSAFHEKVPEFTPSVLLSGGDTLHSYGIDGKIISVPGHTDGSIAIDVGEKYLFVGDALMNMFYPTVSMLYHDRTAMLDSANTIGKLGNRIIYFGHGKPLQNRKWV